MPGGSVGNPSVPGAVQQPHTAMISPTREPTATPLMNTASLCRMGQEMVQDIVQKTNDLFNVQKQLSSLPNGVTSNYVPYQERARAKQSDCLLQLNQQIRTLRQIYNKIAGSCGEPGAEFGNTDLISYEDERGLKPVNTPDYQNANEELREVSEMVRMKNRQLKEIIDKLRSIVWEINTMMAMRYT